MGAGAVLYGINRVYAFTIDDAGIAFAYAEHIARGLGFRAVVSGPVVEGYSDFSWVMLLAAFDRLGLSPTRVAKPLGSLLFALACVCAGAFVRSASATESRTRLPSPPEALPAVLLALCPEFVAWAPSGLENALLWTFLLGGLALDLRERESPGHFPFSACCALGLALTRPEGIVYAAILGVGKAWDALRSPSRRNQLAPFGAVLVVPLAAYHVWHFAKFGAFFPNTYYAKAPGTGGLSEGFGYLRKGLSATSAWFLAPLVGASLFAGLRRTLPALAMAAFALAFAVESRGDWMPHYRFVGYALPPLFALAGVGARVAAGVLSRGMARDVEERAAAFVTLAVGGLWVHHHVPRFATIDRLTWCHLCSRVSDAKDHQRVLQKLGLHSATYLTHDFGGPSLLSSPSFEPLDMIGLCDRSAARLVYADRVQRSPRVEIQLWQYFFHEQDDYPTLLYFPSHFWPRLSESPEYRYGYAEVPVRRSVGSNFASTHLFRGEFVDFFPPVTRFRFEPLGTRFLLVGAAVRDLRGGAVGVHASVLSLSPSREPASFVLRRGGKEGPAVSLFGTVPALGLEIRSDEPVSVELTAPRAAEGAPVELGVRTPSGETTWLDLSQEPPAAVDAPVPRLPFPNDLPGTSDEALLALGRKVAALVAARRDSGDRTLTDPALGRALVDAGNRGPDSYLAYVWATRAVPDLVQTLGERIFQLRPLDRRPGYLMERALLGNFYRTRDPEWQVHLVHFYVGERLWDKATYFAERLPPHAPDVPDVSWMEAVEAARRAVASRKTDPGASGTLSARALAGIDSAEFAGKTPRGWRFRGRAFHAMAGARDHLQETTASAFEGNAYLTSIQGTGTGTAETSPFVVDGRALSFLLAGADDPLLTVELLVDGRVVLRERAGATACFYPVFWDVRAYRGKRAVIRLVDKSATGTLSVDDFRSWDTLTTGLVPPPARVTGATAPR